MLRMQDAAPDTLLHQAKKAKGGFYLNPYVGLQYPLCNRMKVLLSVGYDLQELKRRKEYRDNNVTVHFKEELSHHSLSIKAGVIF
ncbi:MAG: hypothetical protein LUE99_14945 [Bacteroides sp.]|nr:hypothetical protein [Bacteroides sp.]